MRLGFNPNKDKVLEKSEYFHQVIVPVYIPNQEGYFADALKILTLCLDSLFKTCHSKTYFSIVNNGSCRAVSDYLLKLYQENKIHELIITSSIGKLNSIFKGLSGHRFPLVTITDADVLFIGEWQRKTYEVFETFPKAGAVSPLPSSKSYNIFTSNILAEKIFSKNLKFTNVKDAEGLRMFAKSIGNSNFYNSGHLNKYLTIEKAGYKAVVGASHFVCTYRGDIFLNRKVNFSNFKMGGDSENVFLDETVVKKGFWRLAIEHNLAFHMGNRVEAWMYAYLHRPILIQKPRHHRISLFHIQKRSCIIIVLSFFIAKLISKKLIRSMVLKYKGLDNKYISNY